MAFIMERFFFPTDFHWGELINSLKTASTVWGLVILLPVGISEFLLKDQDVEETQIRNPSK